MSRIVASIMAGALISPGAYAQTERAVPAVPAGGLRSQLASDVIKEAVKETLADARKDEKKSDTTVLGADRYEHFGREFSEARVPDCLHPDALKRQPTFFLSGVYALPFVLVAALRGKCR